MKRREMRYFINRIIFVIILLLILLIMMSVEKNTENIDTKDEIIVETSSSDDIYEKERPEIDSKTTDWNLILVNKENPIREEYQFKIKSIENGNNVDSRIVQDLTQMLSDARNNGLKPLICSSYRKTSTQKMLFKRKVNEFIRNGYSSGEAEEKASYWVTKPRTSEHEIGLAVDIVSTGYQILDERQESTEVQKWLIENCYKYGFVLRYPTNKKDITKINYEPWHYRYVGKENALFMKEKNFCLEEYIEYLKKYE